METGEEYEAYWPDRDAGDAEAYLEGLYESVFWRGKYHTTGSQANIQTVIMDCRR